MDETGWLAGLQGGDHRTFHAAFDAVFDAYQPPLWAFLVRLTGGRDELAEELLQETFFRLARHARRLRPDSDLKRWLYTVAHNLWRSHRRWQWLDRERLSEWLAPTPVDRPDEQHQVSVTVDQVDRALAILNPTLREVAVLVIVEEWTPAEVAARLGLAPAAVRQRLARARKIIAEHVPGGGS